jgi:hypothetical protein
MQQYDVPLHDWYVACGGHEIVWDIRHGIGHDAYHLYSFYNHTDEVVFSWFLKHRGCG